MKRKVMVALLVVSLAMTLSVTALATPFPDVSTKHWAYDAVNMLYAAGIIEGYPDGELKGEKEASRYEMIAIVARALQWLNGRIEEEIAKSKEENAAVLEKIVGEAMEKRFGKYPSPDEIAQAIANISEIEQKFTKELKELSDKVDELSKSASKSSEDLSKVSGDIKALREKLETEVGTADVRLTALERQLALYTSELADVKAALQEALKRMDRIRVTGQTKVDLAIVETEGATAVDPDDGEVKPYFAAKGLIPDTSSFTNTLNMQFKIKPEEGVSIIGDMGIKNNLGISTDDQLAFTLDSLNVAVEAEDFTAAFGNLKKITFSDLVLKDWEGEGALITLTGEELKGTSVLFARDEDAGGSGRWIQGFNGAVELDKGFTLSGTYVRRSAEDAISSVGAKMAFLKETVNLAGEYAQAGKGNDKTAVKVEVSGKVDKIDASLTYTQVGKDYRPFGAKYLYDNPAEPEKNLTDKAITEASVSMPIGFLDGLTLKNTYKHTRGISSDTTETRNTTTLLYATKLADFNNSEMTIGCGVTTDGVSRISNNVEFSGNWKLYKNLDLLTTVTREKGATVDKMQLRMDGAYSFKALTFDGKLKYTYKKYIDVAAGEDWIDLISGLNLGRSLTKNAKIELGYENLRHIDTTNSDESAAASVVKAGLAVSF